MFTMSATDRAWVPGKQPGVERAVLQEVENGSRTALIRIGKGAAIEMHGHLGREEIYVVSGHLRVADAVLRTGDYHHTGVGERHDVEAFEDSVFLVMTEKVIPGR